MSATRRAGACTYPHCDCRWPIGSGCAKLDDRPLRQALPGLVELFETLLADPRATAGLAAILADAADVKAAELMRRDLSAASEAAARLADGLRDAGRRLEAEGRA